MDVPELYGQGCVLPVTHAVWDTHLMARTQAELARDGDLDALYEQMDLKTESNADRDVYKWLCCAADFGHDADDLIGDVLEVSSLRYDDDGYEQAAAHWELGVAYLLESDGLTFNAAHARKNLETALAQFSL